MEIINDLIIWCIHVCLSFIIFSHFIPEPHCINLPYHWYCKGTSIRHLRALGKSPWKFIIWMNELYNHCMLLVSYIQQYFNTSITVLSNQVWKLLIALFKEPNTGAFTVQLTLPSIYISYLGILDILIGWVAMLPCMMVVQTIDSEATIVVVIFHAMSSTPPSATAFWPWEEWLTHSALECIKMRSNTIILD